MLTGLGISQIKKNSSEETNAVPLEATITSGVVRWRHQDAGDVP